MKNFSLIISFFSIFAMAQEYPFPNLGQTTFRGVTTGGLGCEVSLGENLQGWTIYRNLQGSNKTISFQSQKEIFSLRGAWQSNDVMSRNQNEFSSLSGSQSLGVVHNVVMRCRLNSQNLPISFTVDAQEVTASGFARPFKRLVDCKNLR